MWTLVIANKNYSSWSLRPWILLRERELPFIERIEPFQAANNRDHFRQFSPTGKVPCLIDEGRVIWESLAITEYVAERDPAVWPEASDARAWARCAAAEMYSGFAALRSQCSMTCGQRIHRPSTSADLQQDLDRLQELWAEGRTRFGGLFLAGSRFTAVDAFFAPVAFRVQSYGLPLDSDAEAYVARLLALPSMQDWYNAALREPWRDAAHEQEIAAAGVITHDFRVGSVG